MPPSQLERAARERCSRLGSLERCSGLQNESDLLCLSASCPCRRASHPQIRSGSTTMTCGGSSFDRPGFQAPLAHWPSLPPPSLCGPYVHTVCVSARGDMTVSKNERARGRGSETTLDKCSQRDLDRFRGERGHPSAIQTTCSCMPAQMM